MKRLLIAGLIGVVLAAAVGAGGVLLGWSRWQAPGPSAETVRVLIPRGTGLKKITALLAENGVLRPGLDTYIFPLGVKLTDQAARLQAGEYDIPPGLTMAEVARRLTAGDGIVQRPFTVAEGLTTPVVLDMLRAVQELDGAITLAPKTGDLLPETYHYLRGDTRDGVIRRMTAAMDSALKELWPTRAKDLPIKTPEEAVVLASIVERETAIAAERPQVAAVFVNRLRLGMPLQSDPTVIYGLSPDTGTLDRPLLRSDLDADHAWNTYVIPGLPPSPIANPGRESLAAVLNPADTKDLYFVADGTGGHAFARTLEEHNRNVAKWRKVQREKRSAGE
ncbi:endolytic transglycosylase MltG [Novispirillum sp. DQ9]|uniref:endolytic transglycosylase MltG n=1 Tax=Novispirillum sp. DQ9 TaxID=3398612 RepID=UPI003C7B3A3D